MVITLVIINFNRNDFSFFTDDLSFLTMDPNYVCTEMVYIGYMTQNYIQLRYMVNDQDPTSKQLLAHHKMVIPGVFVGIWGGYGIPGVSNLACLCEVSAIFLNYRSMWSKEEMNDTLPSINQLAFFFAYLIFRVFMFPYCWYLLYINARWTWHLITWDRKMGIIVSMTLYLVVIVLNFYWFGLILKGLRRMMEEKGVIKKKSDKDAVDDELYMFGVEEKKNQIKESLN